MEADDNALLGLLSLKRISIGPFIGGQHIDYRLSNKSGGRIFLQQNGLGALVFSVQEKSLLKKTVIHSIRVKDADEHDLT